MAEEQIPPVVAVVVSHDPGPWLEECLEALQAQDYANLSVLVVDAASDEPLAARVAAVAPDVYLRRLEENLGFGPSANVVSSLVEGATHYLFCHDDAILEPDALSRMVEEAFRTNAGIVAPKLVDYDEPDRILQLGLGVDRFGAPVRRVERLEFDQAQHDEVREVFAAPGGATLVRSDLFAALGGFDREISMFGEDVDFCWRARLAGARVVVVPVAVVRHLEASASRRRPLPEARALQWRHELRAVLKNYGVVRRAIVGVELALWSLAEIAYFLVLGRRHRAAQVIDAWRWNFSGRGLKAARAEVRGIRRLPDRVVCRLLTRRTFRVSRFVGPLVEQMAERRRRGGPEGSARDIRLRHRRDRRLPEVTAGVVAAIVVLVFGSRSLIFSHLPLVGGFLPLPSPTTLLGHFFGGWQDAGLQRPGPASPAFALIGLLGIIFAGGMGVVMKLCIATAVVAGAIGCARLVRPFGPTTARFAAAVGYLFLPLAWDDIARGDLLGLVAYGGMPFVVARLLRSTGLAPFDEGGDSPRQLAREVILLGLLLGGLGAFAPLIALLAPLLAVVLGLGCVVLGNRRAALRSIGVAASSLVVAFVVTLPWSVSFVQRDLSWSAIIGAASDPSRAPQLGAILRLDFGPLGAGVLGLAFLAAALFVLVSVDEARFAWAARLWFVLLGAAALTWAASEGWIGPGGGALRVFAAPIAVCIAALVGLGVGAVHVELRRSLVGWRHLAALGFAVCCAAGVIPVLGASLSGRWGLPGTGYDSVFNWTEGSGAFAASQRILWLGDPSLLPLASWQIAPGLAAGVSSGGLPDATRLFLSPSPGVERMVARAVVAAESGSTVRLGTLLAPVGIRYVILPTTFAPALTSTSPDETAPPPQLLLDGLTAQSDVHELPSEGGALVFENTTWTPGAHLPPPGGAPGIFRTLGVVLELSVLVGGATLLMFRRRRRRRTRRAVHARDAPVIAEPMPDDGASDDDDATAGDATGEDGAPDEDGAPGDDGAPDDDDASAGDATGEDRAPGGELVADPTDVPTS